MKRSGLFAIVGVFLLPTFANAADNPLPPDLKKGKEVAFDMNKGNCLACHMMGNGPDPGNFGPPLSQMKERYPDRAVLRKQVWDATLKNPTSVMPPFGKHGILTEGEVDAVVDYLYSL